MFKRHLALYALFALYSFSFAQNDVTIKVGDQSFPANLPDYGRIEISPGDGIVRSESLSPEMNMRIIVQLKASPLLAKSRMRALSKRGSLNEIAMQQTHFDQELQAVYSRSVQKHSAYSLDKPSIIHTYKNCFNGVALTVPQGMIEAIRELSTVKQVYEDQEVHAYLDETVSMIGADRVWETVGLKGDGILVGIIDTGIDYTHPALGGGLGPDFKVIGGYDIPNWDADPMDDNGHGTHVAGIIAGNSETMMGIAPNAKLMAFKVLDAGGDGYMSDVIRGIELAVDPDENPLTDDGVDIINMSLGHASRNLDDPDCQAVNTAVEAGVICVVAAGNSGIDGYETIGSPALAQNAISVGAIAKNKAIAAFSSLGPAGVNEVIKPDLVAPGVDIISSELGRLRISHSGTSMASPVVAGVAALLCQKYPEATPNEIKGLLCGSAENLGENFFKQGSGMVDAFNASQLSTSVIPNNLGMGVADATQSVFTSQKYLSVVNLDNKTQTYQLTVRHALPAGVTIGLERSELQLNGGERDSVLVTMSVDNQIVPQLDSYPGSLEGWIDIASVQDTLAVPISMLHIPRIQLSFNTKYCHLSLYKLTGDVKQDPEFYWNLESPCLLTLPTGDYFLKAEMYKDGHQHLVLRELHFEKSLNVELSTSEATHALAAYIDPSLKDKIKTCYWRRYFLDNVSSWCSVTFHFGNSELDTLYVSPYDSERFKMGWIQYAQDLDNNVYLASDFVDGSLTEDRVVGVGPESMVPITFSADVKELSSEVTNYLGFESIAHSNGHSISFSTEHSMPLKNGRFQLYATPTVETPFFYYKFSFYQTDLFEVIDDIYWSSPYLCFYENKMTASTHGFVVEDDDFYMQISNTREIPLLKTNGYFGLAQAPAYPRTGFQVRTTDVRFPSNNFYYQAGDYATKPYDIETAYDLYLNNTCVEQGATIDTILTLPEQGDYRLDLIYDQAAFLGPYASQAFVTTSFDNRKQDSQPPELTNLKLLSNGYLLDPYTTPNNVTVTADFDDNKALDAVSFECVSYTGNDSTRLQLPVTKENGHWSAAIPDNLMDSHVDVIVAASDAAGNSISYRLHPAYINQGITAVSDFAVTPDYIRPDETVTLSATVGDVDGIEKVDVSVVDTNGVSIATIQLFDDGTHQDGEANDHLFANLWQTPDQPLDFSLELTVLDQKNVVMNYSGVIHTTTCDAPRLDLVNAVLERLPNDPIGTLKIHNTGAAAATHVSIHLNDYSYNNTLVEKTIEAINPGDTVDCLIEKLVSSLDYEEDQLLIPVVMSSGRFLWSDTLTLDIAGNAGPLIHDQKITPKSAQPDTTISMECWVYDSDGTLDLEAKVVDDETGAFVDSLDFVFMEVDSWGDAFFKAIWQTGSRSSNFRVVLTATDSLGNVTCDSTSMLFTTLPKPAGKAEVLILGQFNGNANESLIAIEEALDANTISYELWDRTYRDFCDYMILQKYLKKAVIWHPDVYIPSDDDILFQVNQPDEEERYKIKRYLDQGGNLMVTQTDFVAKIRAYDDQYSTRYLSYRTADLSEPVDEIQGLEEDPIGYGLTLKLKPGTLLNAMLLRGSRYGAFVLETPNQEAVAIRTMRDAYHAVLLGFDFKNILEAESRNMLMGRVIQWFKDPATSVEEMKSNMLPEVFAMYPNYPNPFNSRTMIHYQLPKASNVTLQVFDILGRRVAIPINNQKMNAGYYTAAWDGKSGTGATVASGIYFFRFTAGDFNKVQKCVFIQ